VWQFRPSQTTPETAGETVCVCPVLQGRPTGRCESCSGKPPEEPDSQPPAYGEICASKRGEAKLRAVVNANSAASKFHPARDRAGRARTHRAKAAFRAWVSGAARNRSGVQGGGTQRRPGVQLGRPSRTRGQVEGRGSMPWYKATPKAGAVRRESERGIVPVIAETTELGVGKAPHFGGARAARDG
jgi:hypothetical protein